MTFYGVWFRKKVHIIITIIIIIINIIITIIIINGVSELMANPING